MITFFVNQCAGELGRTRLMKLMYMADYEARRFLGRPISDIGYVWYDYGPYDHQLKDRIDVLKGLGAVIEGQVIYPNGKTGHLYSPGATPVPNGFSPVETEILAYVCRQYSKLPLRALLDEVVYETEPMVKAKQEDAKNKPLDMEIVNSTRANELTISLEELLIRSANVRGGDFLTHTQAMSWITEQFARAAA